MLLFLGNIYIFVLYYISATGYATAKKDQQPQQDCIPRCCPQGQILDPSGTKCLRDLSKDVIKDPCSRRDSFLPQCELDQNQQRISPIVTSIKAQSLNSNSTETSNSPRIDHTRSLRGLSKYSIDIHGETIEAFYEDHSARNQSLVENNTADFTMHQIPASFCIDPDNEKILTCPRVGLEKGATVYKCCPFGKQLKLPLFSGCESQPTRLHFKYRWGVPVQGRRLPLSELTRFPSQSLRYDKSRHWRLASKSPCSSNGLNENNNLNEGGSSSSAQSQHPENAVQLLFDYEAFQVDRHGSLIFTRSLGHQRIDNFCIDSVGLGPIHQFMVTVFCRPENVTSWDPTLQKINLPNQAFFVKTSGSNFVICLLLTLIITVNIT